MTINDFILRIYAKHPTVKRAVEKLGIRYVTLIVIPLKDVAPDHHVIVPDNDLRDGAREVIRAANRDLRCHEGDDTVLCVADAQ